jgi:hypothetical protein
LFVRAASGFYWKEIRIIRIIELSDVCGDRLRRELKIAAYGERQILQNLTKILQKSIWLICLILFGFCMISARKGTKTTKDLTTET